MGDLGMISKFVTLGGKFVKIRRRPEVLRCEQMRLDGWVSGH